MMIKSFGYWCGDEKPVMILNLCDNRWCNVKEVGNSGRCHVSVFCDRSFWKAFWWQNSWLYKFYCIHGTWEKNQNKSNPSSTNNLTENVMNRTNFLARYNTLYLFLSSYVSVSFSTAFLQCSYSGICATMIQTCLQQQYIMDYIVTS